MDKFKILVVEDSITNSLLIQSLFEEHSKYIVRLASSGSIALRAIKKEIPDLILLDLMLPDLNGFDILKKLKANGKTKSIPVIIVSARDGIDDMDKGKELGAVDYVTKPIGINNLFERVEKYVTNNLS